MLIGPLLGLPLPVLHILWINLVTDGLPNIEQAALTEQSDLFALANPSAWLFAERSVVNDKPLLVPLDGSGQPAAARAWFNAVAEQLRTDGLAVETVVSSTLRGGVAQVILEVARRHGCDLTVMSTHGHGGLGACLLPPSFRSVGVHRRLACCSRNAVL